MFKQLPITLILGAAALAQPARVPVFEFDVWTRPPSRDVYTLTAEPVTQRMLRAVRFSARLGFPIEPATAAVRGENNFSRLIAPPLQTAPAQAREWCSGRRGEPAGLRLQFSASAC